MPYEGEHESVPIKRGVPRTPPGSPPSPKRSRSRTPRSNSPQSPARKSYSPDDRKGDSRRDRDRDRDRNRRPDDGYERYDHPPPDDGLHFSNYYRSRFGNYSPEEYQNLRVTNIDPKVSNDELRDALNKMDRYGDLQIKIVNSRDPYSRIAYVNFQRTGDAKDARKSYLKKLVAALGKNLSVDPAGVVRDQEGRSITPSYSNGSDRIPASYRLSRDSGYDDRGRGGYGGYRGGGGGYRSRDRDEDRERRYSYEEERGSRYDRR